MRVVFTAVLLIASPISASAADRMLNLPGKLLGGVDLVAPEGRYMSSNDQPAWIVSMDSQSRVTIRTNGKKYLVAPTDLIVHASNSCDVRLSSYLSGHLCPGSPPTRIRGDADHPLTSDRDLAISRTNARCSAEATALGLNGIENRQARFDYRAKCKLNVHL